MAKKKQYETDSVFFLKLVMYFIIGSLWIHFSDFAILGVDRFPVGLIIGLAFAHHDHFQIDRKIEFGVLLIASILSYIAPVGVVIQV